MTRFSCRTAPPPAHPAPDPVPDEEPQTDLVTDAEQYAVVHPRHAAQICALGRLPETAMAGLDPAIGPPSPQLVHAIVTGTSPALRALDPQTGRVTAAAD